MIFEGYIYVLYIKTQYDLSFQSYYNDIIHENKNNKNRRTSWQCNFLSQMFSQRCCLSFYKIYYKEVFLVVSLSSIQQTIMVMTSLFSLTEIEYINISNYQYF